VVLSFDVEMCPGAHRRGVSIEENISWFVFGECRSGRFGLNYELQRLRDCGLKGVFFVDALCAQLFGRKILARIVGPILNEGHEVQLHVHTEWLDDTWNNPVAPRRGANLADFSLEDQCALISIARDHLIAAGAPAPTAFRAGNFGANDDTLRALARIGIAFDASFDAAWLGHTCRISLPPMQVEPIRYLGITELPVSCILVGANAPRHAQVCALSRQEMRDALRHAVVVGQKVFTVVLHSVELISHRGHSANRIVQHRFESLLRFLACNRTLLPTADFEDLAMADLTPSPSVTMLPASTLRSARRFAAQAVSNLLYEHLGPRRMPAGPPRTQPGLLPAHDVG
jgi:hypothetical protein